MLVFLPGAWVRNCQAICICWLLICRFISCLSALFYCSKNLWKRKKSQSVLQLVLFGFQLKLRLICMTPCYIFRWCNEAKKKKKKGVTWLCIFILIVQKGFCDFVNLHRGSQQKQAPQGAWWWEFVLAAGYLSQAVSWRLPAPFCDISEPMVMR